MKSLLFLSFLHQKLTICSFSSLMLATIYINVSIFPKMPYNKKKPPCRSREAFLLYNNVYGDLLQYHLLAIDDVNTLQAIQRLTFTNQLSIQVVYFCTL